MILLTGATGFVGTALLKQLNLSNCIVFGRTAPAYEVGRFVEGEINSSTNFLPALAGVEQVIHCAARVHMMSETATNPLNEFREVNTYGTLALARQAAQSGVKRFIFLSSIKVNGESTQHTAFRYDNPPKPADPYGISKAEAEAGLKLIAQETGMEIVIIRPPLVYGPGVKANFASMITFAEKNWPLPLGAIHNKRSLVFIDNLVDLIVRCIDHPAAANQTFLVSDDCDLSTTELLKLVITAAGKKPRLLPIPAGLLQIGATCIGKKSLAVRLLSSLQVDIAHTKTTLGWSPRFSVTDGIRQCFVKDKSDH